MIRNAGKRTGEGFEIQFYDSETGDNSFVVKTDTVGELAQYLARCCWGNSIGDIPPSVWKDGEKWCFGEYTQLSGDNTLPSTSEDVYLITAVSSESFYSGRESTHWYDADPDAVIKEAYEYYKGNFEASRDEGILSDPDDEMYSFDRFSDCMKAGFAGDMREYVLIQNCNDHLQFEATLLKSADDSSAPKEVKRWKGTDRPVLTFETPEAFLEEVQNRSDLWHPEDNTYVFVYNEDDAICVYHIDEEQAAILDKKVAENEHCRYWSDFLGSGGDIYDDPMDFAESGYTGEWVVVASFPDKL